MVYETQTNELVTVYVCGGALVKNLSRLKTIPFTFFYHLCPYLNKYQKKK